MDVPAYSREDAEERLRQIGRTGKILGPLEGTIRVDERADWMANLVCGVLNARERLASYFRQVAKCKGNGGR